MNLTMQQQRALAQAIMVLADLGMRDDVPTEVQFDGMNSYRDLLAAFQLDGPTTEVDR